MKIININTAGLGYKFVKVSPSSAGYVIARSGFTGVHSRRNEGCWGVTLSRETSDHSTSNALSETAAQNNNRNLKHEQQ